MLTQALRTLEHDGLVTRTVYPTIPPKAVYELTELGHSLTGLLTAIQDCSEEHQDEVLAARRTLTGGRQPRWSRCDRPATSSKTDGRC
ncbi:helix-turn-helix domain-containing protein [Streptomyces sp. NPDC050636]|uniref:winged helix-turn-helix transcriptional regulator n=1 Tax=Streptomyces sp. NPDC050636 TaxID=3154510 RepID=UPI00341C34BD